MKLNILNRAQNELRFELIGEGHTFCNALHAMLLKDDQVDFAGYNILHPLVAEPIVYIRMKGRRKPETALTEASKNLIRRLNTFQRAFQNAMKD